MNSRFLIAFAFLMILLLSGSCTTWPGRAEQAVATQFVIFAPTARAFEFTDSRAACLSSAECVLMKVGGCDHIQAVHQSQIELANAYTEYVKRMEPFVVCAPDLPMEEYEPVCLNRQCLEVVRASRMLLEVPEQPVAGEPFWLGMSFRFYADAGQVDARFVLPESVKVVGGQATWSGPLEARADHVMWVQVQTNTIGKVYLSAWAGIKDGDASISPLAWGRYFTVVRDNSRTPHPPAERVLATPTPGP